MPEEYLKCKAALIKEGKSAKEAEKVCAIAFYKKHVKSIKDAAKEEKLSEDEYLQEYGLAEDVEEYINELQEALQVADNDETKCAWKAPTARKEVPDSHFLWVKETKSGKGKIKKFPYRDDDGSINCSAVATIMRSLRGARSGEDLTSKYPGVMEKAQRIWKNHCDKKVKNSVFKDQGYNGKFFTTVELSDEPETPKQVTIQILRTGKFEHPWYGILDITREKLESMVKNFENNVVGHDISFDFAHMPDIGASAWLEKLYIEDKSDVLADRTKSTLCAVITPTEDGIAALKKKKFRYFSSEYTDNFKNRETGFNYGATLTGGGFTNRPFITFLNPVALSEDMVDELRTGVFNLSDITNYKFEEIDEANLISKQLNNDGDKNNKKLEVSTMDQDDKNKGKEVGKQLDDDATGKSGGKKAQIPEGAIVELSEQLNKAKELSDQQQKQINDMHTKLSESIDINKRLLSEVENLKKANEISYSEKIKLQRETFLVKLSEMKLPPAMVAELGIIITPETMGMKFKNEKGEEITFMDGLYNVFSSMPDQLKVLFQDSGKKTKEQIELENKLKADKQKEDDLDLEAIRNSLTVLGAPLKDVKKT